MPRRTESAAPTGRRLLRRLADAKRMGRKVASLGAILTGLCFLMSCTARASLPKPVAPFTPTPASSFQATPPHIEAGPVLHPPEVHQARLSNGMSVIFVERHDLPLISLNYVSRAAHDPASADAAGIAALTAEMLTQGTRWDDGRIVEIEMGGEAPWWGVTALGTTIGVTSLALNLPEHVKRLARLVRNPALDQRQLLTARTARHHQWFEQSLFIHLQLHEMAQLNLYGPTHSLSVSKSERAKNNERFVIGDVRGFHARHYYPSTSALIVVGATRAAEITALAEQHFGDWRSKDNAASPDLPAPVVQGTKRAVHAALGSDGPAYVTLLLPCPGFAEQNHVIADVVSHTLRTLVTWTKQPRLGRWNTYRPLGRCLNCPVLASFSRRSRLLQSARVKQ